jgi:hypothetical protein
MVAFVNGKFTNASAHTSYLYFVKKPLLRAAAVLRLHLSVFAAGRHFASLFAPHKKTSQLKPSGFRRAGDSNFLNHHPVLGGPPIIHRLNFPGQCFAENISEIISWAVSSADGSTGRGVHYRSAKSCVNLYLK